MEDNLNFQTFLFISSKKLIISVYSDTNKKVFEEEFIVTQNDNYLIFDSLDLFLEKNIFKIEKKLEKFIKKVYIILDTYHFFSIEISLKKNSHGNLFNQKNLDYLLYEAKDYCKKTISDRKIIHMIIENYLVDNKIYSFFPKDMTGNNFSLEVKFICLSNNFIKNLEKILKKYHISLGQVVSANYTHRFLENNDENIFILTKKIINGHNPNEVMLVEKSQKNEGFFEKFFNFFN